MVSTHNQIASSQGRLFFFRYYFLLTIKTTVGLKKALTCRKWANYYPIMAIPLFMAVLISLAHSICQPILNCIPMGQSFATKGKIWVNFGA